MQPLPAQMDLVQRTYEALITRQPVMQALLLLRHTGFVSASGQRGVMVAPLDLTHLHMELGGAPG